MFISYVGNLILSVGKSKVFAPPQLFFNARCCCWRYCN